MPESTPSTSDTIPQGKKRPRIQRACDECRAKKVKCMDADNERCVRCNIHDKACTGRNPSQKKRKEKAADSLARNLQCMHSTLNRITPSEDYRAENEHHSTPVLPPQDLVQISFSDVEDDAECVDDVIDARTDSISVGMKSLLETLGHHFFGQSSGLVFLNRALDIKRSVSRYAEDPLLSTLVRPETAILEVVDSVDDLPFQLSFPEPDLLSVLVEAYFNRVNSFFPLLHRPTFEAGVSTGLHFRSRHFAEVVLLVAASAARYSTDPRVLAGKDASNWFFSGWQWFSQVQLLPKTLVRVSGLHELQKICLACCYLHGTSTPQVIWSLVGVGLRLAQERGIHRRKRPGHVWTVEDELWKRAFWILVCIDRLSCSILGRPCSLHDEDFDAELPAICDDEYWENPDPKQAFKQPEGRPSQTMFFVALIRLTDILAFTLRTVYAVGKFKSYMARSNTRWQEDIVHKIDSRLNKWHDVIPEFLQWPSHPNHSIFYYQSSALYLSYYYVQIQAHRPFIPSIHGPSELSLPSLLICATAARSCSHILAALGTDPTWIAQPFCCPIAFTSGIFLLIHIWEAQKFGFSINSVQELQDARLCLTYLLALKDRLYLAVRFANLLQHLITQEDASNTETVFPPSAYDVYALSGSTTGVGKKEPKVELSSPLTSSPTINGQRPNENNLMDLWRMNSNTHGDGWGLDDITMLQNLGSGDAFYQDMFASFDAPMLDGTNKSLPGQSGSHLGESW